MNLISEDEIKINKRSEKVVSGVFLLLFWLVISLPPNLFSFQGISFLIQHIIVGGILSYIIVQIIDLPVFTADEIKALHLPNIIRLIKYAFWLGWQMVLAGVDVAKRVMRPVPLISPGLVKFRTPLTDDFQITLNANSITLTPGTITIDVEKDEQGSTFWVHSISMEGLESVKNDKGFVNRILAIYK